jgi:pantoate--beta-alanine ligase
MQILTKISEVRALLNGARAEGKTIGFAGTSGRVHEGHLSLLKRAVEENDLVLLGWFGEVKFPWSDNVLPGNYDRDWNRDRELIETTGIKYAFLPDGSDYAPSKPLTVTLVPLLASECPPMEPEAHLNMVSSATAKHFHIFGRCRYYSGEKDWQQLAIFKRMASDLASETEVVGCEVVREDDGLAMSSRNIKLSPEDRAKASALYQALLAGKAAVEGGELSSAAVETIVRDRLNDVGETVYAYCLDAETLQPMATLTGDIRIIASLKLGETPLVDNVGVTAP